MSHRLPVDKQACMEKQSNCWSPYQCAPIPSGQDITAFIRARQKAKGLNSRNWEFPVIAPEATRGQSYTNLVSRRKEVFSDVLQISRLQNYKCHVKYTEYNQNCLKIIIGWGWECLKCSFYAIGTIFVVFIIGVTEMGLSFKSILSNGHPNYC